MPGAARTIDRVHPFRKYFDELEVGDDARHARRTVTEADIVNFAGISGDFFYAHMDDIAARDSLFEKRVAHGYFVLSAAAGLFVDPAPGPGAGQLWARESALREAGLSSATRFRRRLTCKQKTAKEPKPDQPRRGVVAWDVEVKNQTMSPVAVYTILTLVRRRGESRQHGFLACRENRMPRLRLDAAVRPESSARPAGHSGFPGPSEFMTASPSDDTRSGRAQGPGTHSTSLRFRVRLTVVGVSAAVVASFGAVVHRQMSESATRGASEHLERAGREMANMYGASAKTMRAAIAGVAADTEIVEFLRKPDERRAEAAREGLRRLSPGPAVQTWSCGRCRAFAPASDSDWPEMGAERRTSLMDMVRGSDPTAVTPIALLDTTLVYEVVSRVGPQASPLGYVVVRRRLMAPGADGSAQMRAVVGSDALILLGNASGDIWTDMVRRVPMPPAARAASALVEYDDPRRGPVFASMHRIANTPWSLVIEFPRATVLHEVRAGMIATIIFGLAALLIAAVMSWRLSGEFTRPRRRACPARRGPWLRPRSRSAAGVPGVPCPLRSPPRLPRH